MNSLFLGPSTSGCKVFLQSLLVVTSVPGLVATNYYLRVNRSALRSKVHERGTQVLYATTKERDRGGTH